MHLKNVTLEVPADSRVYPKTHTVCVPASASEIILFFFGNYVAHAATVKSSAGDGLQTTALVVVLALLCPTTGMIKAISAILRWAHGGNTDLERAARAGALCMVVRGAFWEPEDGSVIEQSEIVMTLKADENRLQLNPSGVVLKDVIPARLNARRNTAEVREVNNWWTLDNTNIFALRFAGRRIHGSQYLPHGYSLDYVPRDAVIVNLSGSEGTTDSKRTEATISASYSLPKTVIAVFQTVFAAITLYRSRGDEIDRYGYAAFGLTTTPYLVMSILNLLAHIATSDYPAVYLVHSPCLEEAERRGCKFDGTIGKLLPAPSTGIQYFLRFEHVERHVGDDVPQSTRDNLGLQEEWYKKKKNYLVTACDGMGMPLEGIDSKRALMFGDDINNANLATVSVQTAQPFERTVWWHRPSRRQYKPATWLS